MELNIFMRELESALIERGISGETAKKHVSNLRRTFTNDDLSEIEAIQSGSEIEQLADSISLILSRSTRNAVQQSQADDITPSPQPQKPAVPQQRPQTVQSTVPSGRAVQQRPVSRPAPAVPPQEVPAPKPKRQQIELPDDDDDEYYTYAPGKDVTTRGMLLFWVGLFLTLPLTLGLAAVLFGVFAVLFVGLAALIVGLIAALIVVAACGAGVSLVGIIFGITQLFTFLAAGIYEIGLGVMVAGIILFVSILLYNIAIRFLPWLISVLGNFLGWICGKIKTLFFVVRRECYKL
ncbi:MAG: hypothetical protein IJP32_03680 [Clostridia bacterium]|nr:hypothetical protein [Clostridia bacterium]MBQ9995446.1 hypothetical protein [Clostridia bacterium]